ncbi:hypothetical protein LCGC14_2410230, partial [marine sediment metagenome]
VEIVKIGRRPRGHRLLRQWNRGLEGIAFIEIVHGGQPNAFAGKEEGLFAIRSSTFANKRNKPPDLIKLQAIKSVERVCSQKL